MYSSHSYKVLYKCIYQPVTDCSASLYLDKDNIQAVTVLERNTLTCLGSLSLKAKNYVSSQEIIIHNYKLE